MSTEEIPGSISFCLAMLKKGDQGRGTAAVGSVFPSARQPGPLATPSRAPRRRRRGGRRPQRFNSLLIRAERGNSPNWRIATTSGSSCMS